MERFASEDGADAARGLCMRMDLRRVMAVFAMGSSGRGRGRTRSAAGRSIGPVPRRGVSPPTMMGAGKSSKLDFYMGSIDLSL
jgi:hypothetical protein